MARTPRAEAPAVPMPVRLSPAERERVREAARVNHQRVSEFCREALLCAASECLEDARIVIRNARMVPH